MPRSPAAKPPPPPGTLPGTVRPAASQPAGPEIGKASPRPLSGAAAARRSRQEQAGEDLLLHSRTRTVSSGTSWYPAKYPNTSIDDTTLSDGDGPAERTPSRLIEICTPAAARRRARGFPQ